MQFRVKTLAALLFLALPACATSTAASQSPATDEFQSSMQSMHKGMMVQYTGNTDVDFATAMIPHHEGAIEMAKTELKYGTDPKMRQLARQILASQKKEVAAMQKWLNTHPQNQIFK